MKHMKIRKGISLLLALCLCLGMLSTPALAAPGYPGSSTGNTGTADSEKLEALNETVYVYLNVGEGTVTDEKAPEMPKFEVPDASVEEAVKDAQEELDSADKPENFTETAPEAVGDAPTFSGDLEAAKDAMTEAEENLDSAKGELDTQRDTLASTLTEAEDAAKSASEAIASAKAEQEKLQGELDEALGQLEAPADEDKPGAMEDYGTYEEYTAAVDAYNAKVDAYNAACGQLKEKYEQAKTELQGKADAAAQAKESADAKVQEAKDALDAFNTAVDSYNELGKEPPKAVTDYNQALEDYSGEVEEYNKAADEYNEAVDNYNTAAGEYNQRQDVTDYNGKVDAYNDAKDTYDKEFDAYKDSVVKYDEEALEWNTDKAEKNDEAVIGALLGESGSLLDSKYAGQEITVTKEQTDIFDQINSGSIAADALTQEQVDAYNSVVKAYNAAVDQYNANAKKDLIGLLKEDSRFDGQNGSYNADTDTEVNLWYTIGKVDVGSVFQDSPGTIKQDSAGTDSGTDYSSQDGGRDVYYWDKEDGEWTMNAAGSKAEENFESHLNGGLDGLQTAMGSSDNLDYYKEGAGSSASKVDLSEVTSKWVLKVSNGANGYQSETSVNGKLQPSWHLDGYLKVTKLAKLAELAAVPVKNDYSKADRVEAETVETLEKLPDAEESSIEWTAKTETAVSWEGITVEGPGAIELEEPDIPLAAEPITPDEQPEPEPEPEPEPVIPEPTPEPDPDPVVPEPEPTPDPEPVVPDPEPTPDPAPVDPVVPVDPVDPTPPAVDIPEVDVPLAETPVEIPAVAEIPDEPAPLAETPEEIPPVVEIPDEPAPLAETPEEVPAVVEIIDDGVPLADVPKTGDISAVWYLSALLSAAGLLVLTGLERRRSRAK